MGKSSIRLREGKYIFKTGYPYLLTIVADGKANTLVAQSTLLLVSVPDRKVSDFKSQRIIVKQDEFYDVDVDPFAWTVEHINLFAENQIRELQWSKFEESKDGNYLEPVQFVDVNWKAQLSRMRYLGIGLSDDVLKRLIEQSPSEEFVEFLNTLKKIKPITVQSLP